MTLPVFVRSATGTGLSTTPSATLAATPTSGNLLVSYFPGGTTAQTPINSYTQRTVVTDGSGRLTAFYDKIAGGSEPAAQAPATITAAASWSCHALEYSSVDPASRLLVENGQADNDSPKTSPAVDPTDGVDALIVGGCFWNATTGTVSNELVNGSTTGVTERTDPNAGRASATWDWIGVTASGTYTVEATPSASTNGGCQIVIYKGAAAAATPVPHRLALLGVGS